MMSIKKTIIFASKKKTWTTVRRAAGSSLLYTESIVYCRPAITVRSLSALPAVCQWFSIEICRSAHLNGPCSCAGLSNATYILYG